MSSSLIHIISEAHFSGANIILQERLSKLLARVWSPVILGLPSIFIRSFVFMFL